MDTSRISALDFFCLSEVMDKNGLFFEMNQKTYLKILHQSYSATDPEPQSVETVLNGIRSRFNNAMADFQVRVNFTGDGHSRQFIIIEIV